MYLCFLVSRLATIQITNKCVFGNLLVISGMEKLTLLCPSILTGAKQGWFLYVLDNVVLTKRLPARDLYVTIKGIIITRLYGTAHCQLCIVGTLVL